MDAAPVSSQTATHPGNKSSRRLLTRLIGLETEYATMVFDHPQWATKDLPSAEEVYSGICAAIKRDQPTVSGLFDREQMFLASGGAVTFESHPSQHALPGGLVEIATPEVRSPDELLACQRSIDELVAEAAEQASGEFDLRVLKNSSDALGHVYGCQENYETEVASGPWLVVYRLSVTLLWLLQVICLMLSLPIMALTHSMVAISRIRSGDDTRPEPGASAQFETLPSWMQNSLVIVLRFIHFPTVTLLRFVGRHVAFRKQRKYLTALLTSRVAICGTGNLDLDGCYHLSAKALAVDVVADMGSYRGERPIYVYGHWLGQFAAKSFVSLASTGSMFSRRQRLQIGLSDSNLSELAEYVKVGSVSLVLDMIESGQTTDLVSLPRPLDALHQLASDWHLVRRVRTSRGKWSALEIQRHYLRAAKRFVEETAPDQRGEATLVIQRWTELVDVVTAFRREAKNITPALGRVDWLSKRWMIDQLGDEAEWAARKKTDLRYHELSPDGYYRKLAATNPTLALIDDDRIERRRRTPPPDSPATKRGWLIREFAGSDEPLVAEWTHAILGEGKQRRRIEFRVPSE
ncbi:MAG: proteasome accessory factor PafA2 family protein [Planctomycetota bacterium]